MKIARYIPMGLIALGVLLGVTCAAHAAQFDFASPSRSASATFTPAAASHTAGDVVGGAKVFNGVCNPGRRTAITNTTFLLDTGTAEASAFRLYLFSVTPPSAAADDAAFTLASGDRASFLGYVELSTAVDLGDTTYIENASLNKEFACPSTGDVYGYLVNLTTVTTQAVAHVVTLHTRGF